MFRIKREHIYHKLIIGDELNSILLARNSRDITQAEFSTFVWQMPKMDHVFLFTNNQITGVDLIIRDGTWITYLPQGHEVFFEDGTPDRDQYFIQYSVSYNLEGPMDDGYIFNGVKECQELFDSYGYGLN